MKKKVLSSALTIRKETISQADMKPVNGSGDGQHAFGSSLTIATSIMAGN